MINSWIKSVFGKYVEQELIELSILQINNSNSAFLLVKNYLIDTNYFNNFGTNTKKTVFNYFHVVFNRLNFELIKKFLEKMKIVLKKNELKPEYLFLILNSILHYFKNFNNYDNEIQNEKSNIRQEIIEYFKFIYVTFDFDLNKQEHVRYFMIILIFVLLTDRCFFREI